MYLGVMPTEKLGKAYGLMELVKMGSAVKLGDVKTFNKILEENQAAFIHAGTYLVLEQVKIIVYRNLFRRIYVLSETTRLSLSLFVDALSGMDNEADLDEVECILSNLIYQGKIKGYISHQKRFLVVSKTDPFPITSVVKKF